MVWIVLPLLRYFLQSIGSRAMAFFGHHELTAKGLGGVGYALIVGGDDDFAGCTRTGLIVYPLDHWLPRYVQ